MYENLILTSCLVIKWASQVALGVKNPPANAGDIKDVGAIPGSGRSPGEGHGWLTHSGILAWGIPRTEEPDGLQFTGSLRVGHDGVANTKHVFECT